MSGTGTADRLKGKTRWSLNARCPRMAFYAFQGVDPKEPDEKTQRMFERGQGDERWYIERLRKKYGRRNVRTQKAVPWPNTGMPLGELHQDAFIVPESLPVEVKSHLAGGPATLHDVVQLAGEVFYDDEAGDRGTLVVIDRDLNERTIAVTVDPDLPAGEWVRAGDTVRVGVAEVEHRAQQLADAILADVEPARVCGKPSDGVGRMCPFISHCFEGWVQPPRPQVETAAVITLARQLYEITLIKAAVNGNSVDAQAVADQVDRDGIDAALATLSRRDGQTAKGVEALEKEIKRRLTEAIGKAPEDFLHDPGEYEVGPLVLKRKRVDRAEYTVAATSYETLSVKRVGSEPLLMEAKDYGDEAPWSSEDLGAPGGGVSF